MGRTSWCAGMTRWGSKGCAGTISSRPRKRDRLAHDPVGPEIAQQVKLGSARRLRAPVGEIDDLALISTLDRGVRRVDKCLEPLGKPVVAPSQARLAVHALLNDCPLAVVRDDEAMQIKVEAVLHGGAVHLGDEPAGLRQRRAIEADARADGRELQRRLARMSAAPAADMDAELARERRQAALQRADDARRDSR